ncbi:MAG TPA: hypothetical protein VGO57_13760 [Verrucomicrobiae bacterium]|jgi:hypothetical protein
MKKISSLLASAGLLVTSASYADKALDTIQRWAGMAGSGRLGLIDRKRNRLAKKLAISASLFGAIFLVGPTARAISLDDIQVWTGSGTNRAALVIEWSTPEVFNATTVPAPVTEKTLVWGYRFNGNNVNGSQMLSAILAADPKLYVAEEFGDFIVGTGYNLNNNGVIGITDGTATNYFTNGALANPSVDVDADQALNPGDLYWSGLNGPNWETWREAGELGGFLNSPNRGSAPYWTPDDTNSPYSGVHGQWQYSYGIDDAPLADGSWIGLTVAAGGDNYLDDNDPGTIAYNFHKHAPASPDGTYVAYVCNTNDFAVEIVSTNNVYSGSPYNDPLAILNRPALDFLDYFGDGTVHRSKIIEPPYWTDPDGNNVITEINKNGQITVKLGRKIYDNPNNPYGADLIVYGNSFFTAGHLTDFVDDDTDLNVATLSSAPNGSTHPTIVSVSQDGTNWFTYPTVAYLFSSEADRWDDTNSSWTDEEMNPTKPLNPFLYTNNFSGQTVASALDQFVGAAGGSSFDLKASGLPWIQYVRVASTSSTYTVIDAIAAVNPVVVGDALSITPDNLVAGITNLTFQNPTDLRERQIVLNFDFVNANARVNTASLSEFSALAPVTGTVSSAFQITLKPTDGTSTLNYLADIGLRAGENYAGNGDDLRVYQWGGTNWAARAFNFNPTNHEAFVTGITNFSAFVVSQIVPPQLNIQTVTSGTTNGFAFQFTPVPNCAATLERSTDLVTWTALYTFTATNAQPVTLQDFNVPDGKAFYRVRSNP